MYFIENQNIDCQGRKIDKSESAYLIKHTRILGPEFGHLWASRGLSGRPLFHAFKCLKPYKYWCLVNWAILRGLCEDSLCVTIFTVFRRSIFANPWGDFDEKNGVILTIPKMIPFKINTFPRQNRRLLDLILGTPRHQKQCKYLSFFNDFTFSKSQEFRAFKNRT